MHPTKQLLIERNGMYCMLCGRKCTYRELNWHHITPKWVYHKKGIPVDNSYENGSLLCLDCHAYVHEFFYYSETYRLMMEDVKNHKKP